MTKLDEILAAMQPGDRALLSPRDLAVTIDQFDAAVRAWPTPDDRFFLIAADSASNAHGLVTSVWIERR